MPHARRAKGSAQRIRIIGTSFIIRNDFDAVLIQPVCCTYRIPLPDKPSSTCKESRNHVNSANRGNKLVCSYLLPRITFSILPRIPSYCAKVDVRTHFWKGYMRRELAIQHFRQGRCLQHTAPPLFLTWHGVARRRDTRRLSPVPLPLTLLLDHPRRAQPILNGLKHRTCAPNSFQHIVAPLTYTGAQQNLPVCSYERLQA